MIPSKYEFVMLGVFDFSKVIALAYFPLCALIASILFGTPSSNWKIRVVFFERIVTPGIMNKHELLIVGTLITIAALNTYAVFCFKVRGFIVVFCFFFFYSRRLGCSKRLSM